MKKLKLAIRTLLFTVLMFLSSNVNALETNFNIVTSNNVIITQKQTENLKSLGFTNEQIHNMDIDEYEFNKTLTGNVESVDTKYIKSTYIYRKKTNKEISKNELEQIASKTKKIDFDKYELIKVENQEVTEEDYKVVSPYDNNIYITRDVNPDIHETTYKKITTSIIHLSNGRYRLKNDLHWKIMPSNRSYDISAIGVNNAVVEPVSGSHYAKQTYTKRDTCTLTNSQTQEFYNNVSYWKRGSTGYGVNFLLPNDSTATYSWSIFEGTSYPCADGNNRPSGTIWVTVPVIEIDSYMYFEVTKIGNTNPISAYGSYQHSVSSLSWNISHSFTVGIGGNLGYSINVQPSYVSYFDGMAGTHAQVLNPNW